MNPRSMLLLVIVVTLFCVVISFPKNVPVKFSVFGKNVDFTLSSPTINIPFGSKQFFRDLNIQKGLDIQGGVQLTLKADMSKIPLEERKNALEYTKEILGRRIDLYGVAEPLVQTSRVGEEDRILIELPGVKNVDAAVSMVGQTAELDFRELPEQFKDATPGSVPIFAYVTTGLTGKDLKRAAVSYDQNNMLGGPVVELEFSEEGTKKFAEITKRNIGNQVAIFLDDFPVTAPNVNEEISTGKAVISGSFTTESAKQLSIQLNAGALPVSVQIIEQRNIGPSLGQESVNKSVVAGGIGLAIVMLFMIANYGKLGLLADIALIVYALITLSIYKLIPITLTLPGIAGFILSIGMAVDSNILIFERIKEELRRGKSWEKAMELGFGRAWDSIKDANTSTIITALILFNPFNFQWLVTSGLVRGFALTLLIGVFVSLFTGIVVSRTLIRVFHSK